MVTLTEGDGAQDSAVPRQVPLLPLPLRLLLKVAWAGGEKD